MELVSHQNYDLRQESNQAPFLLGLLFLREIRMSDLPSLSPAKVNNEMNKDFIVGEVEAA